MTANCIALYFDKSPAEFPVKNNFIPLGSCGVSGLTNAGNEAMVAYAALQRGLGSGLFAVAPDIVSGVRKAAAELLQVSPTDIAFTKSTAEGINLIANGYPLASGDEIIIYTHEYPSNVYPWKIQGNRGVKTLLLPNRNPYGEEFDGLALAWTMEDLEALVTPRTRILALSHVQFTSGFALDVRTVAQFCKDRSIDFVLDAAQSLGCIPIDGRTPGLSAVVASGWKWLLGPIGSGIFYSTEEFRSKLTLTMGGPDMMVQGVDYLNHTWNPLPSAIRFEYSTTPFALAPGLEHSIRAVSLRYGISAVWTEIQRLQALALSRLDTLRCSPLVLPPKHRSGILSLKTQQDPVPICRKLQAKKIIFTTRGGWLRIAPHFFLEDAELLQAIDALNAAL